MKSYELLHAKLEPLFKIQQKDGRYLLYSVNKQLLPEEVEDVKMLPDGTAIIAIPCSGCALVKYDTENDKIVPVLPTNCFDFKAKLYDGMRFLEHNGRTIVEVHRAGKLAYFDLDGRQLTKFNLSI